MNKNFLLLKSKMKTKRENHLIRQTLRQFGRVQHERI